MNDERVVIKVLNRSTKHDKILREIKILQTLKNSSPNIIDILGVVRNPISGHPFIVTEFVDTGGKSMEKLYKSFVDFDIRFYMYEMMKALDICHSKGIMHRDVKPDNIMIDHANRKLKLIDWGLADFYHPNSRQDC